MGKGGAPYFHVLWVSPSRLKLDIRLNLLSSLATNIIVSSMLILGGSATVAALTGMSTIAVHRSSLLIFHFSEHICVGLFLDPTWGGYLCRGWWYALYFAM